MAIMGRVVPFVPVNGRICHSWRRGRGACRPPLPLLQKCRLAHYWELIYSTRTHGISCWGVQQLYQKAEHRSDLMLVIGTSCGQLLGCFFQKLISPVASSPHVAGLSPYLRRPFGEFEPVELTVLWTFSNEAESTPSSGALCGPMALSGRCGRVQQGSLCFVLDVGDLMTSWHGMSGFSVLPPGL